MPAFTSARAREALVAALRDDPVVQRSLQAYVQAPDFETLLREGLRAGPHEVGGWLALRFTHEQPLLAARVVNLAIRMFRESQEVPVNPRLFASLEAAEDARLALLTNSPELADAERHRAALAGDIASAAGRLERLEDAAALLAAQRDAVMANDLEAIEARQGIRRTLQQLDRVRLERSRLATRYGPRHRKMIAVEEAVSTASEALQSEVVRARRELERRIATNADQLDGVLREHRRATAAVEGFDQRVAELAELGLRVEQAQRRLQSVADYTGGLVEAEVPTAPDRPAYLSWLAAVFAGVMLCSLLLQRFLR